MNALKLIGRGDDLSADEETRFRAWLKQNPDSTKTDAELRQIWKAHDAGSPNALRAAARQPSQSLKDPDREHPGDFADRLGAMRPGRGLTTGDRPMAVPGLAPLTDPQMERTYTGNLNQDPSSYAPQGAMPIAWGGDDQTAPPLDPHNWADIQRRLYEAGRGDAPLNPLPIPPSLKWTPNVPAMQGARQGWVDERDVPVPTWGQRLSENRPATYQADPGMVVSPRRADNDSLQWNMDISPQALRGTPQEWLPSYQQGTNYVPEDGPAKLHEGEMVIPKREADRIRAADMPTVTVKPQRTLSQDEIEKRLRDQGYSPAGAKGIAQNFIRESGGDAGNVTGDHGTSRGLAQWHASRKDELEAFARDQKGSAADPDIQFRFLDKEMKEKFPSLRSQLMASDNTADAESKFRRIFERPASVMWSNDASGRPVLGNDRYNFSDYALGEHQGRRGTSLLYMDPQDYLDLSPPFDDDPKTSRSGRSLRASVGRGDAVESVPSLDMRVQGQTGTVTAQDGRNRALLAQEEGIDAIPVAVRQKGQGEPTEIAGMSGTILPNDFRKAEHVSRETSPDRSILGRAMDMIIPRAEAAEAKPGAASGDDEFWKQGAIPLQTQDGGGDEFWKQGAVAVAGSGQQKPQMSFGDSIMSGMRDPIEGGAQLLSHLMPTGVERGINTANNWLARNTGLVAPVPEGGVDQMVRDREARLQAEGVGTIGRIAGNVASPVNLIPMGALGRAGGALGTGLLGAAGRGAVAGGVGAMTQPVTEGDFTAGKAEQVAGGVLAGGALGTVGGAFPRMLGGPASGTPARSLMDQGVRLTPGQMMGGAKKATEEKLESLPILGDAIRAAQRRSVQDFNRAAYNRVLEPIGEKYQGETVGYDGIKGLGERISQAYDRVLGGVRLRADQAFVDDISNLRDLVSEMPGDHARQFGAVMQNRVMRRLAPSGTMDGQTFKQVESELTTKSFALHGSRDLADRQLGDAFDSVNAALRDNLERTNPGKQAELKAANKAWAMFARVRKAAGNRVSSEGIFTPGDLLAAAKQGDRTAGKGMFARGDALMQDLGADAQKVIGNRYPDSGTAGRAYFGLGLGELATGALAGPIKTAAALGGGAALYTSPAINLLNKVAGPNTRNFLNTMGGRIGPPAGMAAGVAGSSALAPVANSLLGLSGYGPSQ